MGLFVCGVRVFVFIEFNKVVIWVDDILNSVVFKLEYLV